MAEEKKDEKVVQMPKKEKTQEYEIDFGDKGVFVIVPPTMRISREAKAAYSKGWMEGIKQGMMSEDKLRIFVKENNVFSEDLFGQLDKLEEELDEIRTQSIEDTDNEETAKLVAEKQAEITAIRDKMSMLPDTAESYGREYEDAVVVVGSVFRKTSSHKKIPVWKTVDDYLDSRDTSGLTLVLTLFQKLVSYGIEPTEENIKTMFPDLHNLIKSLQEEEETTDE